MSGFYDITRTLTQALEDLSLGIPLAMENEEFEPPDAGVWGAVFMLPVPVETMGKGSTDPDENMGIMQISLFDSNSGGLSGALLQLADLISTEFVHGKEFTFVAFGEKVVYIQNTSHGPGRNEGGFFQIDVSVNWTSYVGR